MLERKKVAIYIDYTLRIPSFNTAYTLLKDFLFQDKPEIETESDLSIIDFWSTEVKKEEVEEFYFKKKLEITDYNLRNKNLEEYFFNKEHYLKFIDDYSYNLYVDCLTPSTKDIEMINIAQKYLFDIDLIDIYSVNRKKSNTMFYLSKIRVLPKSLVFVHEEDSLDESKYISVWNPKKNTEQENGLNLGTFEVWLKELESLHK